MSHVFIHDPPFIHFMRHPTQLPYLLLSLPVFLFTMLSRSFVIVAAAVQSAQSQITSSFKRGLVYVPSAKYPQDDYLWDSPTSDITWYYNYGVMPSRSYADSKLQFVPQLWGQPSDSNSTAFLDSVQSQIREGANISHVLAFNEPDMTANVGGSSIDPTTAAHVWRQEIEPLASLGVKLGSPACSSGPAGVSWMQDFLQACSECTIDFMAVHFYGDFQGLASHIGQYVGTFNKTVWVTEYADPHASLGEAQSFFNQSVTFMDRNP